MRTLTCRTSSRYDLRCCQDVKLQQANKLGPGACIHSLPVCVTFMAMPPGGIFVSECLNRCMTQYHCITRPSGSHACLYVCPGSCIRMHALMHACNQGLVQHCTCGCSHNNQPHLAESKVSNWSCLFLIRVVLVGFLFGFFCVFWGGLLLFLFY